MPHSWIYLCIRAPSILNRFALQLSSTPLDTSNERHTNTPPQLTSKVITHGMRGQGDITRSLIKNRRHRRRPMACIISIASRFCIYMIMSIHYLNTSVTNATRKIPLLKWSEVSWRGAWNIERGQRQHEIMAQAWDLFMPCKSHMHSRNAQGRQGKIVRTKKQCRMSYLVAVRSEAFTNSQAFFNHWLCKFRSKHAT